MDVISERTSIEETEHQIPWQEKAIDYLRSFTAFMFSNIGVIGMVVGYAILGSFVFIGIEGPLEVQRKVTEQEVLAKRRQLTTRLWKITCDLNIFAEETWKISVEEEIKAYQKDVIRAIQDNAYEGEGSTANRWTFSAAFLYSLTVITSIGYGNVTPKSDGGKMATILYAIVGMPLFLLYLSTVGGVLAASFKWTYSRCCQCQTGRMLKRIRTPTPRVSEDGIEEYGFTLDMDPPEEHQTTVPVTLCLSIMIGYVYGGAVLFSNWEKWDMIDGAYFCFISLSTIGFGDIVPGEVISKDDGVELRFIFCAVYLMLGMAIIAMCFNLMQEEVMQKFRNVVRRIERIIGFKLR